ncbi:MAG: hypothetical protein WB816_02810 [Methylocystis sp.]
MTIAAIEGGVAPPIEARAVINAFHAMIRKRAGEELAPWIEPAQSSLITSFANGVANDNSAIGAAIASHWSNGQTEGQTTEPAPEIRTVAGFDFLPDSGEDSRCGSGSFDDEEKPPDAFPGVQGESGFGCDQGREDAR